MHRTVFKRRAPNYIWQHPSKNGYTSSSFALQLIKRFAGQSEGLHHL